MRALWVPAHPFKVNRAEAHAGMRSSQPDHEHTHMPVGAGHILPSQWPPLPHLNRDGLTRLYHLRPVCTCPEEAVYLIAAPLPPIHRTLRHMNKNPAFPHTFSHTASQRKQWESLCAHSPGEQQQHTKSNKPMLPDGRPQPDAGSISSGERCAPAAPEVSQIVSYTAADERRCHVLLFMQPIAAISEISLVQSCNGSVISLSAGISMPEQCDMQC